MPDPYAGTLQDYKRKGFADRVGYGRKPVLLIVDFIVGFTDPRSPLGGDLSSQVAVTRQLLDVFRAQGLPVAYTVIEYEPDFRDAGLFIKKIPSLRVLAKGARECQVDDRIQPRPGELVLSKKFASAFFGTGLDDLLRGRGVDTIIMTGCTTSGCIRASAIDGLQYGYHTIVVREGVGDRAQGPHDANLFDIDAKYGDVVSAQEAQGYLRTLAGDGSLAGQARQDFNRWWNQRPSQA